MKKIIQVRFEMLKLIKGASITYSEALSVKEIVESLKKFGFGYIAVINDQGRLVGIVTDADIRNCLLKDKMSLLNLINKRPRVATPDQSNASVLNLLRKLKIRHIPLVGSNGDYIGVYSIDQHSFNLKKNTVVLMAGGLGARLGHLTENTPKPMLDIGGKPVLEQIINKFIRSGFTNFYISVNYKKHIIMDYFGNGDDFGVNIKYLQEDMQLGTAGALSLINEKISLPVIVSNGDVLTNLDFDIFLKKHTQQDCVATMAIKKHKIFSPYGVVEFDNNDFISGFTEKPCYETYINAGIYALNQDALKFIPKDTYYDMPSLFNELTDRNFRTKVHLVDNYWLDVGNPSDLNQAEADLEKWQV